MRNHFFCVSLILFFASGRCCSVAITQPTHLTATVSLEFSIAVSQPSKLSVSIDGSDVFNGSVVGDFNFALQACFPLPSATPVPGSELILFAGALARNTLPARDCHLRWCQLAMQYFTSNPRMTVFLPRGH